MIDKIKNFYSYENEWKTWSERDKLGWTIILIVAFLLVVIFI